MATQNELQEVAARANNAGIVARNVYNRNPDLNVKQLADAVEDLADSIVRLTQIL